MLFLKNKNKTGPCPDKPLRFLLSTKKFYSVDISGLQHNVARQHTFSFKLILTFIKALCVCTCILRTSQLKHTNVRPLKPSVIVSTCCL